MKHTFIKALIITFGFIQLSVIANAQTVSPTPINVLSPTNTASVSGTITPTTVDKDVESVKNSIANKVEELRKKGQKATAGYISTIKDNQVTIKDSLDATTIIKIDPQLTKIYQITGSSKKEVKQTDLLKNMYIIVSGPLLDNVISANVIYIDQEYLVKSGKIVEVNADIPSLKISTSEKDTITLNIESRLMVQILDSKTLDLSTITSFSKLKEGDTVHFIYTKTGTQKLANTFDALKVVVIPQEYFLQK